MIDYINYEEEPETYQGKWENILYNMGQLGALGSLEEYFLF